MEEKAKFCEFCGNKIEQGEEFCTKCGKKVGETSNMNIQNTLSNQKNNQKMPVWAKVLVGIAVLFFIIIVIPDGEDLESNEKANTSYGSNSGSSTEETEEAVVKPIEKKKVVVPDFSKMKTKNINQWCDKNDIICEIKKEYSKTVMENKFIEQSVEKNTTIYEGDYIEITFSKGKEPSMEYINALITAQNYSDTMHMSKKGIYNQLISEYGEGFEKDAAQYAINHVKANWKKNALETAKSYRETMHMSKSAIYDQLISEYGENFTTEEAQYAINHLDD